MPIPNVYPPKKGRKKLYCHKAAFNTVLNGIWVKKLRDSSFRSHGKSSLSRKERLKKIYDEIAGDMDFRFLRVYAFVLRKFIWKWMFHKIEGHNLSLVKKLAKEDYNIVYIPNHRSHVDYIMMHDTLAQNGLLPPITVAGKNLNFPPVGYFLRKGCAFFVRRTFSGDRVYSAVLKEYLHFLLKERIPIAFFPEGGRSRSGRLLPPKLGIFSMIVDSFLRSPDMKVVFVPTYIGYDKVVESESYVKELGGRKKKKENFIRLLTSFRWLKKRQGNAYLSFGEPLYLDDFLKDCLPEEACYLEDPAITFDMIEEEKSDWYWETVSEIAREVNMRINQSTVVSVASLVSLALMNAEGQKMREDQLHNFMAKMISVSRFSDLFNNVSFPKLQSHLITRNIERMLPIRLEKPKASKEAAKEVFLHSQDTSMLDYSLNNIFHVFALQAFLARILLKYKELDKKSVIKFGVSFYPKVKEEFFLPWSQNQIQEVIIKLLDAMVKVGLLKKDDKKRYRVREMNEIDFKYLQILSRASKKVFPSQ